MNHLNYIRDKVKYLDLSGISENDLHFFPNYLIIGPQRTGTTWLSENLRYHPEIFISNPKEIYFFNCLNIPEHSLYHSNELSWYLDLFKEGTKARFRKSWDYLRKHGVVYSPKVRGEATASYAVMNEVLIQEIFHINPDIKAILMQRDPIERAWSHAKKDLVRNAKRSIDDVKDEEFIKFFNDPYQVSCSNYDKQIATWTKYIKPGHLFVGQFDDISNNPQSLLCSVFDFLSVSSDKKYIPQTVHKRINPTSKSECPEKFRVVLEDILM